MATTPRFVHDCDICTFLGHSHEGNLPVDLYHCAAGPTAAVITRYGNAGPDYHSGIPFLFHIESLREAVLRAVDRRLLSTHEVLSQLRPADHQAFLSLLPPQDQATPAGE